jgi:hypothetical protein
MALMAGGYQGVEKKGVGVGGVDVCTTPPSLPTLCLPWGFMCVTGAAARASPKVFYSEKNQKRAPFLYGWVRRC